MTMDRQGLTRRSFFKGAGLGAAALAATGLAAGCAPQAAAPQSSTEALAETGAAAGWRTAPEPIADDVIAEVLECDVAVLGLSYAGAAAARAAAEAGATVVCMEQQAEGARTFVGQGNFGHINSEFLKSRGVPAVDELEFFNNWQLRSGNRSNAALVRRYCRELGSAFDWYIDGLTEDEKATLTVQFFPTDPSYTVEKNRIQTWPGCVGTAEYQDKLIAGMVQTAVANGGTALWETTVQQLVQDESGTVVGAIGQRADGSYVKVNASKGVIVCLGDFSANAEMCNDLLTQVTSLIPEDGAIVGMGQTGAGVQVCYWAGGRLDPYQATMGGDYYYPCDAPTDPLGSSSPLWLNADGKRYCNEGFGCVELAAMQGATQPQGTFCAIFDDDVETLLKAQGAWHMGMDWPNTGFEALRASMAAAVANGAAGSLGEGGDAGSSTEDGEAVDKATLAGANIFAADSFETLGTYLGYEGEALENFVASIERYNELCEAGVDDDFGKESSLMFPIKNPPFYGYAGEKELGIMLVNGAGVLIDENGQVLGEDYRPIAGLFAAGNTAGSRFGAQYSTPIAGSSVAFAITQGRFTGDYVANL